MNIFFDEHRVMLQNLIRFKVQFILIGGYAVNYHGYNRVTGDMDIWLQPKNDNKLLLLEALLSMGFGHDGLGTITSWNFTTPQKFSIGDSNRPDKMEFMTHISGIDYESADKMKILADIDGLNLPVIHINNLIANKRAAGRTKDIADVEYLEKIVTLRKK